MYSAPRPGPFVVAGGFAVFAAFGATGAVGAFGRATPPGLPGGCVAAGGGVASVGAGGASASGAGLGLGASSTKGAGSTGAADVDGGSATGAGGAGESAAATGGSPDVLVAGELRFITTSVIAETPMMAIVANTASMAIVDREKTWFAGCPGSPESQAFIVFGPASIAGMLTIVGCSTFWADSIT